MNAFNNSLMGLSGSIRTICWYIFDVGFLAVFACFFPIYYCAKTKHPIKEIIKVVTVILVSFLIVITFALWIQYVSDNAVLLSGVTYFVPFLLLSASLVTSCTIFNFWQSTHFISLSYILGRSVSFIGCTIAGCCQGRSVPWGVYSAAVKSCVIPVQFFESLAIFLLWLFLNIKSGKCKNDGYITANCVFGFGLINMISDIFTVIQPKIVYMISIEGIFAFITLCVGLFMRYVLGQKNYNK